MADLPTFTEDVQGWLTIRGSYRLRLAGAFGLVLDPEFESAGVSAVADECPVPALNYCVELNAAFVGVATNAPAQQVVPADEDNPEPQAWPALPQLYPQVASAMTDRRPMSIIIPMQLQVNAVEGYRRTLLHQKWRRCQHLTAFATGLANEGRSQQEFERLLLAAHVGNAGRPEE